MKKWFILASFSLGSISITLAQKARMQIIHNSADAAAENVDIYLDGELFIDDFKFRTASTFIDITSEIEHQIGIAPSTSVSADETFISIPFTFSTGETYVAIANGLISASGYDPIHPFSLNIVDKVRESSDIEGNTDILVLHGSTDAPTVNLAASLDNVGSGTLINGIAYTNFHTSYLELQNGDYTLNITTTTGDLIKSFHAPLKTLNLKDSSITVITSGFLDPTKNSNGADFSLWAALPEGGKLIEFSPSVARVQVIHNAADAATEKVDVYLDGDLYIADFTFRTASPFFDITAEVEHIIGIAPSSSTSINDTITSIPIFPKSNKTYIAIANGLTSISGYDPLLAASIEIFDQGRESADKTGNTDVLVFHGSTDAPTININAVGTGALTNNIAYANFHSPYLELTNDDYTLNVNIIGQSLVKSYHAPLKTLKLKDSAIVIVVSGFLDPTKNSDGADFGLWVALPKGGDLIELTQVYATLNENNDYLMVYPNPANNTVVVYGALNNADLEIRDATGKLVLSKIIFGKEIIDVSHLSRGIYHLNISKDGIQKRTKLILK